MVVNYNNEQHEELAQLIKELNIKLSITLGVLILSGIVIFFFGYFIHFLAIFFIIDVYFSLKIYTTIIGIRNSVKHKRYSVERRVCFQKFEAASITTDSEGKTVKTTDHSVVLEGYDDKRICIDTKEFSKIHEQDECDIIRLYNVNDVIIMPEFSLSAFTRKKSADDFDGMVIKAIK